MELLITSYLSENVGLSEFFLTKVLAEQLRKHLLELYNQDQFKLAGIGNKRKFIQRSDFRSDAIYWLDKTHNHPIENRFFAEMDAWVKFLNTSCYAGITGYEFHYAYYAPGSFYKRHVDQFADNQNRAFSMIMYLNPQWETGDGGELCIYQNDIAQFVTPNFRKCVFFKSNQLEHEVMVSQKPRLSITGWLKVG
jgi:SM-20-related protein